jgi:hypothetical protein
MEFGIIEQRRFEELSVIPGPDNQVIVGSAIVVWSPSLISAFKSVGRCDYPVVVSAAALDHVFDTLRARPAVAIKMETEEVFQGLQWCLWVFEKKFGIDQKSCAPQWRSLMMIWMPPSSR